jgi:hypothetical protein
MTVAELIAQLQKIENKEQDICIFNHIAGDVNITKVEQHWRPASKPDYPKREEKYWITLVGYW